MPGTWRGSAGLWFMLALTAASQVAVQQVLDRDRKVQSPVQPAVPSFPVALTQGLFRRQSAADLLWIRAMSYAGDARFDNNHVMLPRFIHLVLELDPSFEPAYMFGALLLSTERANVPAAIEVLQAAGKRFPGQWRYPLLEGANAFFELGDAHAAHEAWMRASSIPGAPNYLATLAAKALASRGQCVGALETMHSLMEHAQGNTLSMLVAKERVLRWECTMQRLEAAAKAFTTRMGKPPTRLEDLIQSGDLDAIPADPLGGRYLIDPPGRVTSTSRQQRVKFKNMPADQTPVPTPH